MTMQFNSKLAPYFNDFVALKLACGYRYTSEQTLLKRMDRYFLECDCSGESVTRSVIESWTSKRDHERPRTHRSRLWITIQFAKYLRSRGVEAYVPDSRLAPISRTDFVPYIFSHSQIRSLLNAVDNLRFDSRGPERHIVMPELFRLLCSCGLRISEVLSLRVCDVDLDTGTLRILDTKFHKDRLVPTSWAITERLKAYSDTMKFCQPDAIFFPTARGSKYDKRTVYHLFRNLLRQIGITHGGRGKGPRMHDLRHTFAVHCLERWYRNGDDLNARLPLLVTYLGHQTLLGTQRYLQLTPRIFPDINQRLEAFFHDSSSREEAQ
jgi:integrase